MHYTQQLKQSLITNNMKGNLLKTKQGWVVKYDQRTLLLHPDDIKTINQYGDYSVDWDGKEVNFDIIDEFTHPELYKFSAWGEGYGYAKLI